VSPSEPRHGPADFEDRLEQLTARYEERIIELHSVIAELRKKVERHQISVIREEDEFEESDQAQSTHSNDGESLRDENIEISQEFRRVVSEIQPTMDRKPFAPSELGSGLMSDSFQVQIKTETEQGTVEKSTGVGEEDRNEDSLGDPDTSTNAQAEGRERRIDAGGTGVGEEKLPELPPRATRPSSLTRSLSSTLTSDPAVRLEVATLKAHNDELLKQTSEVSELRAHNDHLRGRSLALEAELAQLSQQLGAEQRKKAELSQQVTALQRRVEKLQSHRQQDGDDVLVSPCHSPAKLTQTPPPNSDVRGAEIESYPVAKMAELKKLKTCASDSQILGSEVAMLGVHNSSTAEHLVQAVHQGSGVAELLKSMPGSHSGSGSVGSAGGGSDQQRIGEISASVVAEFEVELERRQARCDHLKAQNDVLSATLEESRSYAERLSVLMGKYESNNTALQLASAFSDHCLEAQDVLTALLDSEMGVLLANCRKGKTSNHDCDQEQQEEVTSTLHRAHHARRKAESVASHLLTRLDRSSGDLRSKTRTVPCTHSTSSTNSSSDAQRASEFTKLDEERLREHIQQLKDERSAVRTTGEYQASSKAMILVLLLPHHEVMLNALYCPYDPQAELKAGSYLLEKETKALELRLAGHEAQESALRVQVEHLQGELQYLQQQQQQQQQYDDSIIHTTPRDLAVAKAREATLKSRVSELLSALEKISRNSDMRHRQSSEFVGDLKRANAALISAFDRAKRKYQGRLKKMEGQLRLLKE
ncbi:hypothetical protein EGW08_010652, partial [Elysia chlorotica]